MSSHTVEFKTPTGWLPPGSNGKPLLSKEEVVTDLELFAGNFRVLKSRGNVKIVQLLEDGKPVPGYTYRLIGGKDVLKHRLEHIRDLV